MIYKNCLSVNTLTVWMPTGIAGRGWSLPVPSGGAEGRSAEPSEQSVRRAQWSKQVPPARGRRPGGQRGGGALGGGCAGACSRDRGNGQPASSL